jgi:hypothetical protein
VKFRTGLGIAAMRELDDISEREDLKASRYAESLSA